MSNPLQGPVVQFVAAVLALGASSAVLASSPCDFVTRSEASHLLGVSAGKKVSQEASSDTHGCLIRAAHGGHDTLSFGVMTVSRQDAPRLRQHMEDERGDEVPSMHGEAWYEVSVPDPKHPGDRRLVIHRDRTSLTLDLHSSHQADAKAAFESIWHDIAERLPFDGR